MATDEPEFMKGFSEDRPPRPPGTATLRDEFAMAALSGLVTAGGYPNAETVARVADIAYKLADAMLARREAR